MKPFKTIRWTVYLNTADEVKAHKLLGRLMEALDCKASSIEVSRDHKDPGQHIVHFIAELNARTIQEAVFKPLRMAEGLSYPWSIGVPSEYAGDRWDFEGLFSGKTKIPGIEWAMFETEN